VKIETLNGPLIVYTESLKNPQLIWTKETEGYLRVNVNPFWGRQYFDLHFTGDRIESYPVAEDQLRTVV